jgi:hypothetical protein
MSNVARKDSKNAGLTDENAGPLSISLIVLLACQLYNP